MIGGVSYMKIMIVEDEPTYRDLLADLTRKWGFKVAKAEEFKDLLSFFISEQPNLILLDINLPYYDGFYWCGKIREISKVPIIFLSSRNTKLDMVMSMNMGGDDFITKDFDPDVLIAKINALLRRTYSYVEQQSNIIEHKGVIANMKDGQVFYGDNRINLSNTEYRILCTLLQKKGEIISREKLMRTLWEDENFVDDNTLSVNITRLRKKLEESGKYDFIITKKGQGYLVE
jgi:DNA-binding response OmpR family regulator